MEAGGFSGPFYLLKRGNYPLSVMFTFQNDANLAKIFKFMIYMKNCLSSVAAVWITCIQTADSLQLNVMFVGEII